MPKNSDIVTVPKSSAAYHEGYRDGLKGGSANLRILAEAINETWLINGRECLYCGALQPGTHKNACPVLIAWAILEDLDTEENIE